MTEGTRYSLVFGGALAIRLVLLAYGAFQDEYLPVKYTDVDYDVYTDAAREVANGNSPFDRTTYRYTPILAYLLLPNIYVHEIFGKLLFVAADLLVGHLLMRVLQLRGLTETRALHYVCIWLFHPFSINISTRGNADSIVVLLVILSLLLIMQKKVVLSAIAYGAAVHFKIYPIVYALAFLVLLSGDFNVSNAKWSTSCQSSFCFWVQLAGQLNRDRVVFGLVSGGLFLSLIGVFYHLYGFQFLYEAYLYHFTRTDNRHNFSVYFYDLYLRYNTPSGFGVGLLAFLPQLSTLITISVVYGHDLSFALFALTMVFVIFNKVCTAQYFLWYTVFFPLILPTTKLRFRWEGAALIGAWFASELHWLFWAFHLEMKGQNTFLPLWIAGLLFFSVNVGVLSILMRNHTFTHLFKRGDIVRLENTKNNKQLVDDTHEIEHDKAE